MYASQDGIFVATAGFFMEKPVWDNASTILDFHFTLVNKEPDSFVEERPEKLIGQLGPDWFVQYKKGLFEVFCDA